MRTDPLISLDEPTAVLVIGVQAAGKTTVGRLLASRFARSVFIEGDWIWQMIVNGREDMDAEGSPEAVSQLQLRYRVGGLLADTYVDAGFVAIHVDNIYGDDVARYLADRSGPVSLIVLRPDVDAVVAREDGRRTSAYAPWIDGERTLHDAVALFDSWLAASPGVGLWVDSSGLTAEETVEHILDCWSATRVTAAALRQLADNSATS